MKVHHIGYAVRSLQAAKQKFQLLGFSPFGEEVMDVARNVRIQFMENAGVLIELITPLKEDSPVSQILSKAGNSPYHVCYEVENIPRTAEELRAQHFLLLSPPSAAVACGGSRVAFLFHKDIGLIELLETGREECGS